MQCLSIPHSFHNPRSRTKLLDVVVCSHQLLIMISSTVHLTHLIHRNHRRMLPLLGRKVRQTFLIEFLINRLFVDAVHWLEQPGKLSARLEIPTAAIKHFDSILSKRNGEQKTRHTHLSDGSFERRWISSRVAFSETKEKSLRPVIFAVFHEENLFELAPLERFPNPQLLYLFFIIIASRKLLVFDSSSQCRRRRRRRSLSSRIFRISYIIPLRGLFSCLCGFPSQYGRSSPNCRVWSWWGGGSRNFLPTCNWTPGNFRLIIQLSNPNYLALCAPHKNCQ